MMNEAMWASAERRAGINAALMRPAELNSFHSRASAGWRLRGWRVQNYRGPNAGMECAQEFAL